jgi:DNA replicative helicase MCM subunit Mcm2 (Cdc46/Mcm family)
LSNLVEKEDVDAAKRIIAVSLREVGIDENGELDAGVQNGLPSKSQMDRIELLIKTIRKYGNEDIIITEMGNHGYEENTIKYDINNLSKRGKIYKGDNEFWKVI